MKLIYIYYLGDIIKLIEGIAFDMNQNIKWICQSSRFIMRFFILNQFKRNASD